jgi:hypothetical protein
MNYWPKTIFVQALMAMLLACGCAGRLSELELYSGEKPDFRADPRPLDINYLGAGGFYIRRGSDAILTAPYFSNRNLLRVVAGPLRPDPEAIEAFLPPEADDVAAILVGHAHFDHAMDLPYIARYRATNAVIYGNNTLKNILLADLPPDRLESVQNSAGVYHLNGRAGGWIYLPERNVRFMALESEHAPHFWGIKFFGGEVREPQRRLPRTGWGWKDGMTLAYLIDFMGTDGSIDFRILYQDTAVNSPPYGGIPALPEDEQRPPDVLILCMASFDQVRNYPEGVIQMTAPRQIIVGHWEDFFRPADEQLRVVRLTNGQKFMDRLHHAAPETPAYLPKPGAWMRFERNEQGLR